MTDELTYYRIEKELFVGAWCWRFYSLYNGARGIWTSREHAVEEGEAHKALIIALHPSLKRIDGIVKLREPGPPPIPEPVPDGLYDYFKARRIRKGRKPGTRPVTKPPKK